MVYLYILIGVCATLIIETCLYVVYNLGKRSNKKVKIEELNREQLEKIKKNNEGWNNIFNYSVDTAYGRGE